MIVAVLLVLAPLAAAVPASTYPHVREPATSSFAPLHTASNAIPDNYIVVLKDDASLEDLELHTSFVHNNALRVGNNIGVKNLFMKTLKGYSGHFDEHTLDLIRASPEVAYVEHDQEVWALETQKSAPWGLARVSHRDRLGFSTFTKYEYDPQGGEGVDVYVIDTGINIHHVSFEGRASWGHTMPAGDEDEDGNGHGTHCAGTIASRDYGVAKKAHVIAVKVLRSNGQGSMSDVIGGVEWAATAAAEKAKVVRAEEIKTGVRSSFKGSAANMSLGGGKSRALDDMINAAVDSGLHIAVAAGNDNKDACNYSPAAAEGAITVGASTLSDDRAYFSNWGKCVDVFAPGLNIKSTWKGSPEAINTISGTSMASPHVAGLLAYFLSLAPSKFDPSQHALAAQPASVIESVLSSSSNPTFSALYTLAKAVMPASYFSVSAEELVEQMAPIPSPVDPKVLKQVVLDLSTSGKLNDVNGSPNLLIYNNYTAAHRIMEEYASQLY